MSSAEIQPQATRSIAAVLAEIAAMMVVAAASLLLLLYVGYGDGKRTYELFHVEKLTAQGSLVQNSIEKFVRDGLPLKQYAGFSTLVAPLLESDDIDAVAVYDMEGRQLFGGGGGSGRTSPADNPPQAVKHVGTAVELQRSETHYQVVLPIRTRFETIGSVVVYSRQSLVAQRLVQSFIPLLAIAAGLAVLFSLIVVWAKPYMARLGGRYLQIAYGCTFMFMAVFVVGTLVLLYVDGIQGKAKASASTMAQRLTDLVVFNLSFADFDGIDRALREYRRINPEVSEAAVLLNKSVEIATEAELAGQEWKPDTGSNFEYAVELSQRASGPSSAFAVTVPRSVVFERVLRSVKNFAALFIASAFLSGLFLQVAGSIRSGPMRNPQDAAGEAGLVLIKPVFFLAVFLDSLTYSFLPKYMQDIAVESGLSAGFASAPFTAYYLCFALSLIPAGTLCDRVGSKPIILFGLLVAAGSVLCLGLPGDIWTMTGLRGLAGIGQGFLLIGVQSYILAVAPPDKRTQGAAIIVFGFQGGLISGMALGSLMFNILQAEGVFAIAGGVGAAILIYTVFLIPRSERKQAPVTLGAAVRKLGNELKNVITSLEFLNTLVCIGMPAKAILTGVVTFAIPLILGQAGYRPEDIGQVVMLYGLGVVVSSGYVSRLVDRTKNTEFVLFLGALISGAGLALFGLMDGPLLGNGPLSTIVVVIAVTAVGVAHGFINAPVVTHVGQSHLAKQLGAAPVTTAYRFLERGGHVAGPLVLSQLFLIWGQGPHIVGAIGISVAALALLFVGGSLLTRPQKLQAEPAE